MNSNLSCIDTWPVPHHSGDLCVMITFQARNTELDFGGGGGGGHDYIPPKFHFLGIK